MKLHRPLIEGVTALLYSIFVEGKQADHAVEKALKAHPQWGGRDRRFVAEAVYDCVRWWRWLWHLAGLPDAECMVSERITVERIWLVWAASRVEKGHPVPDFPECAGLDVDTVARRMAEAVPSAVRHSVPDWLWELGAAELKDGWPEVMASLNLPASVCLRVNTLRATRETVSRELGDAGIPTMLVEGCADALLLLERKSLAGSAALREGRMEIQDAGSQRIAPLLQVQPGMFVVDACAGAGGKSLHLAALMTNKGRILAMDIRGQALEKLKVRAARCGVRVLQTRQVLPDEPLTELAGKADAVLLDVPCSGLGVLRRHPDSKWKSTPESLAALRVMQRNILRQRSLLVKPGGTLVYATCSVLPSENGMQVTGFLAENAGWILEEELALTPASGDHDGFYAARLRRQ